MNSGEFRTWFDGHCARFAGIGAWMAKLPNVRSEGFASKADVLQEWRDALSDVTLTDATRASKAMFAGDLEPPREWSMHPAAIRAASKGYSSSRHTAGNAFGHYGPGRRTIGGEVTFKCLDCHDRGCVEVYGPETMHKAVNDPAWLNSTPRAGVRYGAVPCHCEEGDRFAERFDMQRSARFDAGRMVPLSMRLDSPETIEAMRAAIDAPVQNGAWDGR